MTDFAVKSRINELKAAINDLDIIYHEACEAAGNCSKCGMRINETCIPKETESGPNIIIRQYQEMKKTEVKK